MTEGVDEHQHDPRGACLCAFYARATEAALTGHFVLTTLHTNNALQAVTRLVEIGVEPYLVAPTTMASVSAAMS